MNWPRSLQLLIIVFFLLNPRAGSASAPNDIEQLLNAADEQRSANPERFATLLTQLKLTAGEMTESQRQYLAFLLAYQAAYSGNHQQAESQLRILMEPNTPVLLRFRASFTIANVQIIRRQFVDAFSSLAQAMTLLPEIPEAKWRNQALLSAATIYSEAALYQESQDFLQQLDVSQQSPRDLCISSNLRLQNNLASKIQNSLPDIQQVIAQCEQAKELMFIQIVKTYMAVFYLDAKDPKTALDILNGNLSAAEGTGYNRLLIQFYLLMAQAKADLGDVPGAITELDKLIVSAQNLPFSVPLVAGFKLKAELLTRLDDYQGAYQSYQQYSEAERAMRNDRSEQLLAYQLAKGELLKKNQELRLVREEFRVIELENQLKNRQATENRNYIGLLSVATIMLLYLTYRLLSRHRFYKLAAENDGLTGISNRHFFDIQLQKQVKRCKQAQQSIGVIVFDLDFFKQINDKFGHDIGDKALQATVHICNHFIRSGDIFGRIGGEEFAIVLPNCQPDKVLMLAEICRDAIEQLDCSAIKSDLHITASFGVSYSQISGYQAAELMRHADQALYLAKYNGRNRVESYDQMQPSPGRPLIHNPLR